LDSLAVAALPNESDDPEDEDELDGMQANEK